MIDRDYEQFCASCGAWGPMRTHWHDLDTSKECLACGAVHDGVIPERKVVSVMIDRLVRDAQARLAQALRQDVSRHWRQILATRPRPAGWIDAKISEEVDFITAFPAHSRTAVRVPTVRRTHLTLLAEPDSPFAAKLQQNSMTWHAFRIVEVDLCAKWSLVELRMNDCGEAEFFFQEVSAND